VHSHADTSTAGLVGAILAGAHDLAVLVNLVVLQGRQLHLLSLVVSLLGLGVSLLLSLLGTTAKSQHKVKSGLLLNVVVTTSAGRTTVSTTTSWTSSNCSPQSASILQLLTSEDETLLIRRNTFLVLDLGLDIVNGVRRLNLKGDRLPRERLHEDLHFFK
jgi:hypothetical protein